MVSFYQKNQQAIFTLAVLISLLMGVLAPRLMAYLPGILGVMFVFTLHKDLKGIFPYKLTLMVLGIIVLCLASVVNAPDIDFALQRVGKIACILLPSLLFIAACRHKEILEVPPLLKKLVIAHFLIAAFLLYERVSGHQLSDFILGRNLSAHHLNRAFVVFSLSSVFLTFLCRAQSKNWLCVFVVLSTAIPLAYSISQTAQLSFIVGVSFLLFFPTHLKFLTRSMLAAIIVFSLSFPFFIAPLKKAIPEEYLLEGLILEASIIHRLEVWQHSAQKTFEKPIFGQGIEALRFLKSSEWMKYQQADSILHSHNSALQIWVEFGAIGILLACGFLAYLFRRIEKVQDQSAQRLYLTMLITCLCISFTGYGLWQSWQLGMFIFFAGLSVLFTREDRLSKA